MACNPRTAAHPRTAALGTLLLLAALAPVEALRGHAARNPTAEAAKAAGTAVKESYQHSREWTYFPANARFGIVTGGRKDLYENKSGWASKTAEIMLAYAKKHGFAIHVNRDLGSLSDRAPTWNKVALMRKLLGDVPLLAWVNPNVIATNPKTSLEMLFKGAACNGARQPQWEDALPQRTGDSTWLWLNGAGHSAGKYQWPLNANTDVMMMRRCQAAERFLERAWALGDDPRLPSRYASLNKDRVKGWPFENGAIWELVTKDTLRIMANTCIAPAGYLESRWNAAADTVNFGRVISDDMDAGYRGHILGGALALTKMPLY